MISTQLPEGPWVDIAIDLLEIPGGNHLLVVIDYPILVTRCRVGGYKGALDGGPQCCMSNLRNGNVPCLYLCNIHVDFKIV